MIESKTPPQALDLEQAILGACMVDNVYHKVREIITHEDFYRPEHQDIFKAFEQLSKKGSEIDILTVFEVSKEITSVQYLSELTGKVASSAHVEAHCMIVKQKSVQRSVIRLSTLAIQDAYEDMENLDKYLIELIKLKESKKGFVKIDRVVTESIKDIRNKMSGITCDIKTGIEKFDGISGGLKSGQFYTIGARTAMGKTAFMCTLINNICVVGGRKTAVFSLEMSADQISKRILSLKSGVELSKMDRGDINADELQEVDKESNELYESDLYIDDSSGYDITQLKSKIISVVAEHQVEVIFVDFIQRMKMGKEVRDSVTQITRGLADVAKELNVTVVALSQLSRDGAKGRPNLTHLKESGSIEEDSYGVIFIHRPAYFGEKYMEDGSSSEDKAELIIAKHRNGRTGIADVGFYSKTMLFYNL